MDRRRNLPIVLASGALVSVVACTLVVDTGGLAGEASAAPGSEGGVDAGADVAGDVAAPILEGGGADDAGPDAGPDPGLAYRDAVLADRPVAYYRLGETSGASAKDERGAKDALYRNPIFGTPALIRGDDPAARFDGASVITSGDVIDVDGTNPFSLELWLAPSVIDGVYRYPIIKESGTSTSRRGCALFFHEDGLNFERYAGGSGFFLRIGGIAQGVVLHVVATYDRTDLRLYANGVLVQAKQDVRPIAMSVPDAMFIGANNNDISNGFKGAIDEVAVYDKALDESRIVVHYQLGHR